MTPAARLQAAIECLDLVLAAARDQGASADTIVQRYFATRRYAGSKDRAAVRDLLWAAIRRAGEPPASGRAGLLGLAQDRPDLLPLFDGSPHAPAPVQPGETPSPAGLMPRWLMQRLQTRFGEATPAHAAALLERAPFDLRVNLLKGNPVTVAAALPVAAAAVDTLPLPLPAALRAASPFNIAASAAFHAGEIEVQDAGSQFVTTLAATRPGETVIDLCAGAGGKTLALAADMRNQGRLIATDTDRARLSQLAPRAARAGAVVETRLLNPGHEAELLGDLADAADLVLVDAPCSGSGTWRRNPEARWRLTPKRLERLIELQSRLLDVAAPLVRPAGRLCFAVCSVLEEEGARQADAFVARHPAFTLQARYALTPLEHGCDGFFVALFRRT